MALLPEHLPGEKLLIRLWETVEKVGIGFARPWLMRREGQARASVEYMNALAVAQAEEDLKRLQSGEWRYDHLTGKLVEVALPLPVQPLPPSLPASSPNEPVETNADTPRLGSALGYAQRSVQTAMVRHLREEINLESILQRAEGIASDDVSDPPADRDVDIDWLERWRENAKGVSDADVQQLWAHVLAGEIKNPGRYSLRTLEFLRTISRSDAELIQKLGPFVIDRFIFNDGDILEKNGIPYDSLHDLQVLGIVSGVEALSLTWTANPEGKRQNTGFICNEVAVVVPNNDKKIELPCLIVTKMGQEVLSLGKFEAHGAYLKAFVAFLVSKGFTCNIGRLETDSSGRQRLATPFETMGPTK